MVGVFTVPDVNGRADPLADAAENDGVPVFKYKRWRNKGKVIPEVRIMWAVALHVSNNKTLSVHSNVLIVGHFM